MTSIAPEKHPPHMTEALTVAFEFLQAATSVERFLFKRELFRWYLRWKVDPAVNHVPTEDFPKLPRWALKTTVHHIRLALASTHEITHEYVVGYVISVIFNCSQSELQNHKEESLPC